MLNAERRETLSTFWKCNEQVPVHGKQPIPMLSGSPGHMGDSVGSASVHTSSPSRAAYPVERTEPTHSSPWSASEGAGSNWR